MLHELSRTAANVYLWLSTPEDSKSNRCYRHLAWMTPTPLSKNETERREAEASKQEMEARCAVLQETTNRLEDDLARLTAQARSAFEFL